MKRVLTYLYIICSAALLHAQDAGAAFQFLQLPSSSHAAALGGDNTSIIEDDVTLAYHNPALLANVSGSTLSFNYMSYLQRTHVASAAYNMLVGDRSALAFGAHYLNYGSMKNTDAEGNIIGNFSAKDMALMTTYSFDFSDRLSGGHTVNDSANTEITSRLPSDALLLKDRICPVTSSMEPPDTSMASSTCSLTKTGKRSTVPDNRSTSSGKRKNRLSWFS